MRLLLLLSHARSWTWGIVIHCEVLALEDWGDETKTKMKIVETTGSGTDMRFLVKGKNGKKRKKEKKENKNMVIMARNKNLG